MYSTRYAFRILMKLQVSLQVFEKGLSIKFHQNTSIWRRIVPCGQTDMTKLIVAFRNFAKAPNKLSWRMQQENDWPFPRKFVKKYDYVNNDGV
jgi:hypothetical protein